jgi:hypothetical protein
VRSFLVEELDGLTVAPVAADHVVASDPVVATSAAPKPVLGTPRVFDSHGFSFPIGQSGLAIDLLDSYNNCYVQAMQMRGNVKSTIPTVTIPASFAASIARLLRRCAQLETERAQGRTVVPKVVMIEIAAESKHWARYLDPDSPEPEGDGAPKVWRP